MWLMPASHATVTRRPATNRPITRVFGPWRSKNRSPLGNSFGRASRAIGILPRALRPPFLAIQYPVLSPTIAPAAATAITSTMLKRPVEARTAEAMSAVSPGSGIPADSTATRPKSRISPYVSRSWLTDIPASVWGETRTGATSGRVYARVAAQMRVGVPKEIVEGEHRVALVPDTVTKLEGFAVSVEK